MNKSRHTWGENPLPWGENPLPWGENPLPWGENPLPGSASEAAAKPPARAGSDLCPHRRICGAGGLPAKRARAAAQARDWLRARPRGGADRPLRRAGASTPLTTTRAPPRGRGSTPLTSTATWFGPFQLVIPRAPRPLHVVARPLLLLSPSHLSIAPLRRRSSSSPRPRRSRRRRWRPRRPRRPTGRCARRVVREAILLEPATIRSSGHLRLKAWSHRHSPIRCV